MQLSAKLDNETIVKTKIRGLEGRTTNKVLKAMRDGGFLILASAKRNCPVDTGRLRSSLTINWTGSGMARGEITNPSPKTKPTDSVANPGSAGGEFSVVVGSNVEYAKHVEFGFLKGKHPRGVGTIPFLYPAYQANYNRIINMVKSAMREV